MYWSLYLLRLLKIKLSLHWRLCRWGWWVLIPASPFFSWFGCRIKHTTFASKEPNCIYIIMLYQRHQPIWFKHSHIYILFLCVKMPFVNVVQPAICLPPSQCLAGQQHSYRLKKTLFNGVVYCPAFISSHTTQLCV